MEHNSRYKIGYIQDGGIIPPGIVFAPYIPMTTTETFKILDEFGQISNVPKSFYEEIEYSDKFKLKFMKNSIRFSINKILKKHCI